MGGTIYINGRPKDDEVFRRITGYVEQNDIHDPHATVREGLLFSARMVRDVQVHCCPCFLATPVRVLCRGLQRMEHPLPDPDLRVYVNDVLHMLELEDVADILVGDADTGLPVGEKKRYTIGVELVTNPSVLFLGPYTWCQCHGV